MGGKSGEEKLWKETGKWRGLVVNIYVHKCQTLSVHPTVFLTNGALQEKKMAAKKHVPLGQTTPGNC
jgi:hypothetical protein